MAQINKLATQFGKHKEKEPLQFAIKLKCHTRRVIQSSKYTLFPSCVFRMQNSVHIASSATKYISNISSTLIKLIKRYMNVICADILHIDGSFGESSIFGLQCKQWLEMEMK